MKEILTSLVVTFGLPLMMPMLTTVSQDVDKNQAVIEKSVNLASEKSKIEQVPKSEKEYIIQFLPSEEVREMLKEQTEITLFKEKGEEIKKEEIEAFFAEDALLGEIILKNKDDQELTLNEIDGMKIEKSETFKLLFNKKADPSEQPQDRTEESHEKEVFVGDEASPVLTRSIPPLVNSERILPLSTIFADAVGNGPKLIQDGKALQIGSNQQKQKGAIWSKKKINLNKDFKMRSQIYLGVNYTDYKPPADGITFTLHNDNRGTKAIGGHGSGLGVYSSGKDKNIYIKNALSFEFDTYYNDVVGDKMDEDVPSLYKIFGHVGFAIPSNYNYTGGENHYNVAQLEYGVTSHSWYSFDVEWNASRKELSVIFLNNRPLNEEGVFAKDSKLTYKINDIYKTFGSNEVYWGFTGSTGDFYANSAIAMSAIPNSISHTAKLKHESDSDYVEEIDAKQDDIIDIKDTLILDDVYSQFYSGAYIYIDLNDLEYQDGTLLIDDNKVDSKNIDIKGDRMKVTLGELASKMGKTADLKMKVKVKTDKSNETRDYRFIFIDDGIVSDSNDIKINLKEKPMEVTNFSLNSQIKNKSSEDEFSNEIQAYKGQEIIIQDIIKAQDDETKFRKGDRLITQLPHLDMEHLKININGTSLKTDNFSVLEEDKVVITLQDEELLEALNSKKELVLQIETAIKNTVTENQLKYNFDYEAGNYKEKSNDVMIHIKEEILRLKEVPETIDFGRHEISSAHKDFWSETKGDLVVEEFRPENAGKWTLTVKEKKPLTNELSPKHNLLGKMIWNNLYEKEYITQQETIIEKHKHKGDYKVNDTWKQDEKGISIEVPIGNQLKGNYKGELQWQLKNTP